MRKAIAATAAVAAGLTTSMVIAPEAGAIPRAEYERLAADTVCDRYDSGRVAALSRGILGWVNTVCVLPHEKDDAGWAHAWGRNIEWVVPNGNASWKIDPANPFSDWEVAVEIHQRY